MQSWGSQDPWDMPAPTAFIFPKNPLCCEADRPLGGSWIPGNRNERMNAKSRCLQCVGLRGGLNEAAPQRGRRLPHSTQWAQKAGQGLTAKGLGCRGNLGKSLPTPAWGLPNGLPTVCVTFLSMSTRKRLAGTLMDPKGPSTGMTRPEQAIPACSVPRFPGLDWVPSAVGLPLASLRLWTPDRGRNMAVTIEPPFPSQLNTAFSKVGKREEYLVSVTITHPNTDRSPTFAKHLHHVASKPCL